MIQRYFTDPTNNYVSPGQLPYETVKWVKSDAHIPSHREDAPPVYHQADVVFPSFWSKTAVNIVASKYFYGRDADREYSLMQLISRVVGKITREGEKAGYFKTDEEQSTFHSELTYILLHQIASFNSPVWFNIGVDDRRQTPSACFINSVEDTMDSILELAQTEGKIFQFGSGAGVNLSPLRAEGEPLSGGGSSSGPISFMKGFDAFAGVIKSGGTTRRAAKMVILDIDHPDIEKFIECKTLEEKKAKALIREGYDSRLDGEAYTSVFFQNANHSVRVDDEFMEAFQSNGEYSLRSRATETTNSVSAVELLSKIAQNAWETGDPGIQFSSVINKWHTTPSHGDIVASNPCSEYLHLNDTSCNLASIRLTSFDDPDGEYNWDGLIHTAKVLTVAMDILIEFGEFPNEKITKGTKNSRTLGIGFTDLGAFLMLNGLAYDSHEAREQSAALAAAITFSTYNQSAKLAERLGSFKNYAGNEESMRKVLQNHMRAFLRLRIDSGLKEKISTLLKPLILDGSPLPPIRNAQASVIAPTGTISFMMDCESTGIEPVLAPVQYKTLVGGGTLTISPECIRVAKKLGYDEKVMETSLGDRVLSPTAHLNMVAAVQPMISGAISKTINLPSDTTVEEILNLYVAAWGLGVKCVTVYRDGCKSSQPLSTTKLQVLTPPVSNQFGRLKMPRTRRGVTHQFALGGQNGYLTVGEYDDGSPGEVFVKMSKQGSTISGLLDAWALNLSLMIQYGVPLDMLVEKHKHTRYEPSGFTGDPDVPTATSVTDYVMRWIEFRYLNGSLNESPSTSATGSPVAHSGSICSNCGGMMSRTGTCESCLSCGNTGGC